ncbi:flavin-containing monooxygenase [Thalassotalea crassostreae]|uniref:flavin-containing monooxygenase n=1 Tax=Thalassotalea crassostreae TaxID=1763536 RepID=UPI0008391788|nr:NAD(P)-binding domain-containing protein [Thalassotalea crassostreae]
MYDFIIVGGSQAGLAMGYELKKLGMNFLIVDGNDEIGGAWLKRWDSLTLFTTREFNNLPGLAFEGVREYPNKHDVADYLKRYVKHFQLPVQLNTLVTGLHKTANGYELNSNVGDLICKNVVVATGPFHTPFTPEFATKINPSVTQIHASDYRNPKQLQKGETLVVGGGDSGVQILSEVADLGEKTYCSGITSLASLPQKFLGKTLWWWLEKLGVLSLSKYNWLGKQINKRMQPVIGTDVKALLARINVTNVGRTLDATNDSIRCVNCELSSVKNIIWATGFKPDFSWMGDIDLDDSGYPVNYRGVSNIDGIYYIGLPWMYTRGSATLGGVAKDAKYLGQYIGDLKTTPIAEQPALIQ